MKYYLEDYTDTHGYVMFKALLRQSETFDNNLLCPKQEDDVPCGEWCPFFCIKTEQFNPDTRILSLTKVQLLCMPNILTLLIEEEEPEDADSSV